MAGERFSRTWRSLWEVRFMKEMPKLGTGKIDYVTLRGMVEG